MSKVHVFTSAAFNYIPKVRMLFDSIRKYHPDWVLHIALPDVVHDEIDLSQEVFDYVIPVEALDIPDYKGWAFCHRIVELATAIKPFALRHILERDDCDKVFYFDPDMVLFSPVEDLLSLLDTNNLLLTPHVGEPEDDIMAVMNNEISALKHGIYNLGFIGLKNNDESKRFATWWSKRLYNFCRDEIGNGLFTDQRWIDHVPVFFDGVHIVKSPRHNVAPWNLTKRAITGDFEKGFLVNGEPLGFYHFTGFDSGDHKVMMELNSNGNDSARRLFKWYKDQTENLSKDPLSQVPWAFARFDTGAAISPIQRIAYRERGDLQNAFPDPFAAGGFEAWWTANAKIEFPELTDQGEDPEGHLMRRLKTHLSAGFGAGQKRVTFSKIKQFWTAFMVPAKRKEMLSRGLESLK